MPKSVFISLARFSSGPIRRTGAALAAMLLVPALALLPGGITPVRADEARVLRLAVVDMAPYGFVHNGEPAGLGLELGELLAAGAGAGTTATLSSRRQILQALARGEADMAVLPGGPPPGRGAVNAGPLLQSQFAAIARSGTPLRSRHDLAGKTVAVVRDEPGDPLLSTRQGVALLPVPDLSRGLKLLLAGKVDAVAAERLALLHAVDALHLPARALGSPLPLSPVRVDLLLSPTLSPALLQRLDQARQVLTEREDFRATAARYGL
ncbi:transporter substrate-binding domain-containing protein [Pseudodesulfovibrio sp. F-1]|uniref:Transporter substrate-binding domain-containing protein n=1 Tax=Pseudodesulfovibrio alkaliphilus TaxID=2661613 RepID=A0A7K1KMH1_9BACT|nr:transporter substrate-binding domain-containing protein [Pseudodesulfovibrio alkaliphilus]MUM77240.1 transporter substrate-binding domain-containing protein [Pseudodesulfovibrio alkaliphilus]